MNTSKSKLSLLGRLASRASGYADITAAYVLQFVAWLLILVARMLRSRFAKWLAECYCDLRAWLNGEKFVEVDLLAPDGEFLETVSLPRWEWDFLQKEAKKRGVPWQDIMREAFDYLKAEQDSRKAVAA